MPSSASCVNASCPKAERRPGGTSARSPGRVAAVETRWHTGQPAAYGLVMTSTLRTVLRSRLTTAMRERDRSAVSVLRTAVAAIENAEAVPVGDGPEGAASTPASAFTSPDVAGAAVGLGVTEAERRRLDHATERSVVVLEVSSLVEAETAYAAAGDRERARSAALGAALLQSVLDEADRPGG